MEISFNDLCKAVYYQAACEETWGANGRNIHVQSVRRRWLQRHLIERAEAANA